MLSIKQTEYLQHCNHRWNIKVGATGSGKSWIDYAVVIAKRIMACRGEGAIVLMGNTRGTLCRNIIDPMREIWGETLVGNLRADSTIMLFGKRAHVLGADNKKHVARIQGMTIEYAYGDEMTTWVQDVFEMLKSRLRCEHSHFDGTCNPDTPHHYIKTFLDSDADIYCQTSTIDDNPFLPPEFVTELKKEYAGTVYYQRFILGLWAAAEGTIYRLFADDPDRYTIDAAPPIQFAIIGVDFGGNGSATAFVCNGITPGFREVVSLDEHYHKGVQSPQELERDFIDFVRRCQSKYRVYTAYCDSAEQTLIEGLRWAAVRERLPIEVVNAIKGPINDRIRFYSALMGADRYKIMRHCKHLKEAFQTAVWSDKDKTKDIRLDDGSRNIDSLDALEYSTEAIMQDIIPMLRR